MRTPETSEIESKKEEILYITHIWIEIRWPAMIDLSSLIGTGFGTALFAIAYAVYAKDYKRNLKIQKIGMQVGD